MSSFRFLLTCQFGLGRLHHLILRVHNGLVTDIAYPETYSQEYRQSLPGKQEPGEMFNTIFASVVL